MRRHDLTKKKVNGEDEYKDEDNDKDEKFREYLHRDLRDLWYLRHWIQFWQLGTWFHDNLCYLTIKSDTGQHSQFLRWFYSLIDMDDGYRRTMFFISKMRNCRRFERVGQNQPRDLSNFKVSKCSWFGLFKHFGEIKRLRNRTAHGLKGWDRVSQERYLFNFEFENVKKKCYLMIWTYAQVHPGNFQPFHFYLQRFS